MKPYKLLFLAAALLALFSSGAGRMLNDMTIVQAISLDEVEGAVCLGIQYLDLNKGSGKNEGLNSSLTENAFSKGKTVDEAVKKLSKTLPDDYFTGQAKLLIVGEKFKQTRMEELEKTLKKDRRIRCDILLAECDGYAFNALKNPFRNERVPIDGICKQLRREKALVTLCDYLKSSDKSLPEIRLGKNYGMVVK